MTVRDIFIGLMGTALMGWIIASLMLLYLSSIKDEKRLVRIQQRLPRAGARPPLVYAVIVAGLAALLFLNYKTLTGVDVFGTKSVEVPIAEPEPQPSELPPGWPADLPIPPGSTP